MKRIFRLSVWLIASVVGILITYFTVDALTKTNKNVSNPDLLFVKNDWKGNPLDDEGNFVNHEYPMNNDFTNVIKWQLESNPQKEEKKLDSFKLKVRDASAFLKDSRDGMIWIGHATFLIRLNGKLIITDPIFTVPSFMMKRLSKLPIKPEDLNHIDYILLSHDHYDHLNKESFQLLIKNNPNAKILTGLELGKFVEEWLQGNQFQEAGWYQQYNLTSDDIKITFLPTRHWSTRGIGGFNKRLWGAFMIQTDSLSIYFGSDSGYGSHFKEVKEIFGSPDYSMIGIGAYKPEWFMAQSHTSPTDALLAANDMNTRNFIPMHYGTFDLSDEPIGDPHREVHRIYNEKYSRNFGLITPDLGEVIYF